VIDKMINNIKNKYNIACYSPKLNKIILIDGGRTKLVNRKGKLIEYYYDYADEHLFGKTMKADKFESLYTMCWELENGSFEQDR